MRLVRLEGPVEQVGEELQLRIPLVAGGDELAKVAVGISRVEGGELVIEIQPWLAQALGIGVGSSVIVDNENGKFNITLGD